MRVVINGEEFIPVSEAARILGVSPATIRRWSRKTGLCLPCMIDQMNGYRWFKRSDVEALKDRWIRRPTVEAEIRASKQDLKAD